MGWQQSVLHPRCSTLGWQLTSTLKGSWVTVVPDCRGEGTEFMHWIRPPFIGCITCTLEQAIKVQRGSRGILLLFFLTSELDGGGWSASRPGRLYLRERPCTLCTGGWVVPRAGPDRCGKSRPPPGFDPWNVQPVTSCYTDYATLLLHVYSPKYKMWFFPGSLSGKGSLPYNCIQN
jgi:hypothetical protein